MRRVLRLALAHVVLLSVAAGQEAAVPVRLVPREGDAWQADLGTWTAEALVVHSARGLRTVAPKDLRAVVFLPPPGARAPDPAGLEVAPLCAWRLEERLERVLARLAAEARRPIEVDAEVAPRRVALALDAATWRTALAAVAGRVDAEVEEGPTGPRLAPDAAAAPFRVVVARPPAPAAAPDAPAAPPEQAPDVDLIAPALAWLARAQRSDGAWSGALPAGAFDRGTTALALRAFLSVGHSHRFGDHKQAVRRSLELLRARPVASADGPATNVERLLVATALCEAYAVTRDYLLKAPATAELAEALAARGPGGGWGLRPHAAEDTFSTWLGIQALLAAQAAGLALPPASLEAARDRLRAATGEDGRAGLRRPGRGLALTLADPAAAPAAPLFTACAVAGRRRAGEPRADCAPALEHLLASPPRPETWDPATWHAAALALAPDGDARGKAWLARLRGAALALRHAEDDELAGSWAPAGLWGDLGGRVATTAATVLALEVEARARRVAQQAGEPEEPPAPRLGGR